MADVVSVAEYVLSKMGSMTAMKLQKIIYYSQAWHLAWTEKTLFPETIEAWRDGPVVPKLFEMHKGQFKLQPGFFLSKLKKTDMPSLTADEKDIVDRVINYYGQKDPHWLSQLTHLEDPWKEARSHCDAGDYSSKEISVQSMFEYYSSL